MSFYIIRHKDTKTIATFDVEAGDFCIDVNIFMGTNPTFDGPVATFSSYEKAFAAIHVKGSSRRGTFENPSAFWGSYCRDEVEIVEVVVP